MKKTEERYTGPRSGDQRRDARQERYRQRRRNIFLIRLIVILLLLLVLAFGAFFILSTVSGNGFHPQEQLNSVGEFFTSVFHLGGSKDADQAADDAGTSGQASDTAGTAGQASDADGTAAQTQDASSAADA